MSSKKQFPDPPRTQVLPGKAGRARPTHLVRQAGSGGVAGEADTLAVAGQGVNETIDLGAGKGSKSPGSIFGNPQRTDPADSYRKDPLKVEQRPRPEMDDGKTRPVRPGVKKEMNPVLGWLVVLRGADQGRSFEIQYGVHSIGREGQNTIQLSDATVSRETHASIEYEPRERKFYLGRGENFVYLNGERVGLKAQCALEPGDEIEIGATLLKFVPLCSESFDWSDIKDEHQGG